MILAKSDGTTLQEHIEDCLIIADDIKCVLSHLMNDYHFEHLLILAICFHDFGKLHPEFQKLLKNQENDWEHQRHEVYSVIFTNKIVLKKKDAILIQKAILGHHKSFEELREKHLSDKELEEDYQDYWKYRGNKFHPKDILKNLPRFKQDDLKELMSAIDCILNARDIEYTMRTIQYSKQKDPVEQLAKYHQEFEHFSYEHFRHLLFSGLVKMCDHYGSAKIQSLPHLTSDHFNFVRSFSHPFNHQLQCWAESENVVLIAPTGSGKTECAMGWLEKTLMNGMGKVFYILPYTASINAMHQRLCLAIENTEPIDSTLIGVQHGKIDQYLNQFIDADYDSLKEKSNTFKKMIHPFKITTPFQILKYFFGIKAFEIGLVNLYGAKIIFDEIHAYDVATFAQLVVIIGFLTRFFRASIFVMTATLPTFQRKEIEDALGKATLIKPQEKFLKSINRHRVSIYQGDMFSAIDALESEIIKAPQVMLVLNTVNQAQECYRKICEIYPEEKICLIHGRFTANDRLRNENLAFDKDTKFLIGTQAIEVSLDIDYDLMITDPAPLDALLQRFGRVNRKGNKKGGPAPIYVCRKSSGNDGKIYPREIVEKTLDVLSGIDILRESGVQNLIDEVYPDWLPEQKKEFEDTKNLFAMSLESLQPYSKYKEREEEFYDKFDDVKVLPTVFYSEYKKLIEAGQFIEADGLMVGLHKSTYRRLKFNDSRPMIELCRFSIVKTNDTIITTTVVVAKCRYSHQIGLIINEFQEIDCYEDRFV
jgi:CRISPR-associated endonuclease/helicase Cas3